jgi:hypothetical protein
MRQNSEQYFMASLKCIYSQAAYKNKFKSCHFLVCPKLIENNAITREITGADLRRSSVC